MTNVWMHIGVGSFQRAHQAWYLHRLLKEKAQEQWTVDGKAGIHRGIPQDPSAYAGMGV